MIPDQDKQYTAFISYSHMDGETFAEQLRKRILDDERGEGITFWQDYSDMRSGNWSTQIEEAINAVEFLIMIITPAALASGNCKDEWIYARKKGICIMPVNGLPEQGDFYKQFPAWLKPAHVYNLDKQWPRFINDLNTKPPTQPVPFMARRLAGITNYVPRKEELIKIKGLLLNEENNSISITTTLQGSGGFGKTTLAIALCNDDDIINAFTDGILWVTLGQKADVIGAFKKLYEGLTGEEKSFIDIENAQQKLRDVLEKRNCIIVIDDAWNRGDLKPIVDAIQGKTVLITSRFTNILDSELSTVKVNEMKDHEGVKLLTGLFKDKLSEIITPFKDFSKELGNWPLLLKLAGSQINILVKEGEKPEQALNYVKKQLQKKGLHSFKYDNATERNDSVKICLDASVELLSADEKYLLMQLGIFPEDQAIPFNVISGLWDLDEFDTEEPLLKYSSYGLIDIDLSKKAASIHDILLKYYNENLGTEKAQLLNKKLTESFGNFRQFKEQYAYKN
jgi:hypothetical protein